MAIPHMGRSGGFGAFRPTYDWLMDHHIDITDPNMPVEVKFNEDRSVMWVNVGPVCILRVCQIGEGTLVLGGSLGSKPNKVLISKE